MKKEDKILNDILEEKKNKRLKVAYYFFSFFVYTIIAFVIYYVFIPQPYFNIYKDASYEYEQSKLQKQ